MFRFQSINQVGTKIKAIGHKLDKNEVYMVISVILVGFGAYFMGKIQGLEQGRPQVTIERFMLENTQLAAAISTSGTTTPVIQPFKATSKTVKSATPAKKKSTAKKPSTKKKIVLTP